MTFGYQMKLEADRVNQKQAEEKRVGGREKSEPQSLELS